MKTRFTFFLLFCFGWFALLGQGTKTDSTKTKKDSLQSLQQSTAAANEFLKNTSIASPTAAALGKYADVPINYNTGLPSIGIPLTIVKGSQLSLPISLSYHGGGHKVAETASWVGLGWSLIAGGVISRQVMGGPDESWNGANKGTLPSTQGQAGIITISGFYNDYGYNLPQYVFGNPNTQESFEKQYKFICAGVGLLDTEPDIFSFNVGGTSGKFYFDAARKAHFIPEQDFKVEVLYSGNPTYEFDTFILTSPDGTRYHFGGDAYEKTGTISGDAYGGSYFKSSWYLTKIESADRLDAITLSYVNEGLSFLNLNDEYHEESSTGPTQHVISGGEPLTTAFFSRTQVEGKRLSEINSSQMRVVFGANTVREDVSSVFTKRGDLSRVFETPKRLDELSVMSATDNTEKIKFKFSYDYFQSVAPPTGTFESDLWIANITDNSDKKRLRLLNVQEVSGDESIVKPPHTFSYEQTTLPRRLSYGRDHWGYANGQQNNRSLIDDAYISPRPNRSPLWSALKAGHLEKITYPTGGSVAFTFEPHYTDETKTTYIGGLRIGIVKEMFSTGQFTETTYTYGSYILPTNETNYRFSVPSSFSVWRDFVNINWSAGSPLPFYSSSCPTYDSNDRPSSASVSRIYNSALYGSLKTFLGASPLYQNVKVSKLGAGYSVFLYGDITPFTAAQSFPFTSGSMVNYVNNGKLTREEYYNEAAQLQRKVIYEYNPLPDYSLGATITAYKWFPFSICSTWLSFAVNKYSYYPTRSLLLSKTETTYDLNGTNAHSQETKYGYGANHQSYIRMAMAKSNGDSLVVERKFVQDYGSFTGFLATGFPQRLKDLSDRNIHVPIEELTFLKKGIETNATMQAINGRLMYYDVYAPSSNNLKPSAVYALKVGSSPISVSRSSLSGGVFGQDIRYEKRVTTAFSTAGLLSSEALERGATTAYAYGSTGLLTSKTMGSGLSVSQTTNFSSKNFFGLTQLTDPSGKSRYFAYDKLGRLATSRWHTNELDDKFTYAYATTITPPPTPSNLQWDISRNTCSNTDGTNSVFRVFVTGIGTGASVEFSVDGSNWFAANYGADGYQVSVPYNGGGGQYFAARPSDNPTGGSISGTLTKCAFSGGVAAPTISVTSSTLCNVTLTASGCSGTVNWSNGSTGNSISVASGMSMSYSATCTVGSTTSASSTPLSVPTLPSGWLSTAIGGSTAGCTQTSSGSLSMQSNGSLGGTNPDNVHYVYRTMSGDFTLIAKVSSLTSDDGDRAGFMIRSDLGSQAPDFTLFQDGNTYVGTFHRLSQGASNTFGSFQQASLNNTWLKIVKTGNDFSYYYSTNANPEANNAWQDGTNFNLVNGGTFPQVVSVGSSYLLGFATWGAATQATFSNITINGQAF